MDGFDGGEIEARYPIDEASDTFDKFLKTPVMDRATACAFADAFCAGEPWRLRLSVYGVKGDGQDFERDGDKNAVDAHWDELEALQARGNQVFFYLSKIRDGRGAGTTGCATNADVEQLQTLSVDFDGGLPERYHAEPDFIVKTSMRLLPDGCLVQRGQALWRVWSSADFSVEQNTALFREAQLRLAAYYDPTGMAGWLKDKKNPGPQITDKAVTDPRRVHRLPGSLHLKDAANPQLVTFERRYSGPVRGIGLVYGDLPPLPEMEQPAEPEKPKSADASESPRRAVTEIVLRETLSWIDPPADEPEWRKLVAAIKATPLLDGDGEDVACDWSSGRLDRDGKYVGSAPPNWGGNEVVRQKYAVAKEDKPGGRVAGFGTLVYEARRGGMPQDDRIPREWRAAAAAMGPQAALAMGAAGSPDQAGPAIDDDDFVLLDLAETRAIPPPVPIIPGLLYQRENVALVAVLKSGKTFVGLDLALSIASGELIFGNTEGLVAENIGAVVFCSGEGHGGFPARIDAWFQARGVEPPVPFYYIKKVPQAKEWKSQSLRLVTAIRRKLGAETPILIIVDTLARSIMGLDENVTDTANVYHSMTERMVKELGCTVLTIAHASNKDQAKWTKNHEPDFRGSSAFGAGFDTTWTLMRADRGDIAKLAPRWSKNNELSDLRTFYFRIVSVYLDERDGALLTGGRKGAVLQLASRFDYEATWPLTKKEAKEQAKARQEEAATFDYIPAVLKVFTTNGAWPGSGTHFQWCEGNPDDRPPTRGRGGMTTGAFTIDVLRAKLGRSPTQLEIDAEGKHLRRMGREGGALRQFVRSEEGGYCWALPEAPRRK